MPIHRIPTRGHPARLERMIVVLRTRPSTIAELAAALRITPKTARTYLSEISRTYGITAEGPYGATRYAISAEG